MNENHFSHTTLYGNLIIEVLILIGLLTPPQREWAEEYYKRDPEGFRKYLKGTKYPPPGRSGG